MKERVRIELKMWMLFVLFVKVLFVIPQLCFTLSLN